MYAYVLYLALNGLLLQCTEWKTFFKNAVGTISCSLQNSWIRKILVQRLPALRITALYMLFVFVFGRKPSGLRKDMS